MSDDSQRRVMWSRWWRVCLGQSKIGLEAESVADDLRQDRIVEAIGDTDQAAIRDHKQAGNSIAEWRGGRVVIVPPEEIED